MSALGGGADISMMGKLAYLGNSIRLSHWFAVLFSMGRHISRHFYKLQAQRTAKAVHKSLNRSTVIHISVDPIFSVTLGQRTLP